MDFWTILVAIAWGVMSGYFIVRAVDSLIAVFFCLHGLFNERWKRLSEKIPRGQIKSGIILRLMARVGIYAVLFIALLRLGFTFTTRELGFDYSGWGAWLYLAVAVVVALSRMPNSLLRLKLIWKMSHEFDFAERRRRTQMLKR